MSRRRGVLLLVLAGLLGASAPVFAQPASGLVLEWEAPPACPPRAALLEQVAKDHGGAPLAAPALHVRARVAADEGAGFSLDAELYSDAGVDTRHLTAPSCSSLADALVVLIDVALDAKPAPAPAAAAPPVPPPAQDTVLRLALAARLELQTALLPSPTPGFGLRAGLLWAPFELWVHAAYLLPATKHVDALDARFDAWSFGLSSCYLGAQLGSVALGPCAAFSSAIVRGSAHPLAGSAPVSARADAASLSIAVRISRESRFFIEPELGVTLVLRRPSFEVGGVGVIARPDSIGPLAVLSFGFVP